jgi:hypothetical protein
MNFFLIICQKFFSPICLHLVNYKVVAKGLEITFLPYANCAHNCRKHRHSLRLAFCIKFGS